jgi:hypothetical protein
MIPGFRHLALGRIIKPPIYPHISRFLQEWWGICDSIQLLFQSGLGVNEIQVTGHFQVFASVLFDAVFAASVIAIS